MMQVTATGRPAMAIAQQRMTLEEFLKLPEEEPALEFEEGMVTQKVAPQGRHSALQFAVADYFNRQASPGKLARAFPELRATFAGRSVVPDVAVYLWERIPRDASGRIADVFREPPDLVVEIASPDQRVTALVRRCLWYVANGVRLVLLIDPDDESVLVFRPGAQPVALRAGDTLDFGELIPGAQLGVQELFDTLRL